MSSCPMTTTTSPTAPTRTSLIVYTPYDNRLLPVSDALGVQIEHRWWCWHHRSVKYKIHFVFPLYLSNVDQVIIISDPLPDHWFIWDVVWHQFFFLRISRNSPNVFYKGTQFVVILKWNAKKDTRRVFDRK